MDIHQRSMLIDAHCDTLIKLLAEDRMLGQPSLTGHIDLVKLNAGGVNVQFFAVFIHPDYGEDSGIARAMELINVFYQQCQKYSSQLALATCQDDLIRIVQSGKIAAILAIEGGEALGGQLYMLPIYYLLGVRCITLTWNGRNSIADGVGVKSAAGLTSFGLKVIREMNNLGMLIDVSHLAEIGFWEVLAVSNQPVLATHSNCAALCDHPRNLNDRQIIALAKAGGVIGLTLVPEFISEYQPSLDKYLDHFDHIVDLVGPEHIGIGTDFDGIDETILEVSDCAMLPQITAGLIKRGYDD